MSDTIDAIFKDIVNERAKQVARWGLENDDKNTWADWRNHIIKYLDKSISTNTNDDWRDEMIKVASLAVAAVENYEINKSKSPMTHFKIKSSLSMLDTIISMTNHLTEKDSHLVASTLRMSQRELDKANYDLVEDETVNRLKICIATLKVMLVKSPPNNDVLSDKERALLNVCRDCGHLHSSLTILCDVVSTGCECGCSLHMPSSEVRE